MNDSGHHASKQLAINYYGIQHSYGFIWLSDYIGSIWVSCCTKYGVIGLRFGWVLATVFGSIITCLLYLCIFKNNRVFITSFIAAIFVASRSLMSLNYDSISSIFLLLLIALYLAALYPTKKPFTKRQAFFFTALSGIVFTLAIQSRITFILFVCVPVILIALPIINNKELFKFWSRLSQYFLLSFIASYFLFIGFLYFIDNLDYYVNGYLNNIKRMHTDSRYFIQLFNQLKNILIVFFATFLLLISGTIYPFKKNKNLMAIFGIGSVFIISFLVSLFLSKMNNWNVIGIIGFSVLIAISIYEIIILYLIFNEQKKSIFIYYIAILVFGIIEMVLQSFGASAAIGKASNGMWLLAPAILLVLPTTYMKALPSCKLLVIHQNNKQIINAQIVSLTLLLIAIAFWTQLSLAYGDVKDRSLMTSPLKSTKAKYILTTKERANRVDEVVKAIRSRTKKGEPIFIYNYASMLYFLTDTIPATQQTLPTVFYLNHKAIIREINFLCSKENRPRYAVAAKFFTGSPYWELKKQKQMPRRKLKKFQFANEAIKKCRPIIDWESSHFIIYKLN